MKHLGKVEQDFEAGLDMALDPGIRAYVLALREGGVETFESCEGGKGHPFTEPTVRFFGPVSAGFRAYAVACERDLPVSALRLAYPVDEHKMLTGPWWEMTFYSRGRDAQGSTDPVAPVAGSERRAADRQCRS